MAHAGVTVQSSGAGVVGPEALPPVPFLDMLAGEYDSPWELDDRTPSA